MRAKFPSTRLLGRRIFTCAGAVGIDGPRMLLNFKQALKIFAARRSKEDLVLSPNLSRILHGKTWLAQKLCERTCDMPSPSPACKVQTCLICVATWNSNPATPTETSASSGACAFWYSCSGKHFKFHCWSILISFMASSQQVHQLFVSWEVIVSILNHCIAKISNWRVRQLTQPGCWSSCECSIGLGRSHKRNLRIEMHGENRLCECLLLSNEHTALRWSSHLESGRKSPINGAIRPKYAVYLIMVERCIHFPARMITQATYIFKQRKVFWEGQVATENRSSAAASEHLKDQIPGETWMTWGDSNKLGLRCLLTLRLILQW